MTDRLYLKDAYCKNFSATVLSCLEIDGQWGVELDRTAFFPEGGGQAADQGTIQGFPVKDVQEIDGRVLHFLDVEMSEGKAGETEWYVKSNPETKLRVGDMVECAIDWALRYARMQAHTGEHILSGTVHKRFHYDNVGFHMNDSMMVVDFNGPLTGEDIDAIELAANEAIYQNAEVRAWYPSAEEVVSLEYRSKLDITEDLRIVTIGEGIDSCACCAPHVARTGEVGLIKVLNFYPHKQGTRIEMVAGSVALRDYIRLNASVRELMRLTSATREGIVETVRKRYDEYQDLCYENRQQACRLALLELETQSLDDVIYGFAEELSFEELRFCANHYAETGCRMCLLLSQNAGECIYVASSKTEDVQPLVKALNETFAGKGGDKAGYAQGKISVRDRGEIEEFLGNALF
ncbi:MAG: alanyl-tRNA editing protein [Lachnospiraceae bacterium]|nr:alanyl-tRNA editing protein [Lachnospiraceae bacterium]